MKIICNYKFNIKNIKFIYFYLIIINYFQNYLN